MGSEMIILTDDIIEARTPGERIDKMKNVVKESRPVKTLKRFGTKCIDVALCRPSAATPGDQISNHASFHRVQADDKKSRIHRVASPLVNGAKAVRKAAKAVGESLDKWWEQSWFTLPRRRRMAAYEFPIDWDEPEHGFCADGPGADSKSDAQVTGTQTPPKTASIDSHSHSDESNHGSHSNLKDDSGPKSVNSKVTTNNDASTSA